VLLPPVKRGDIVDRRGEIIATSLSTASLYVNPKLIIDPKEAADKLATVIRDIPKEELEAKLRSPKSFVWIKRNLTPTQQESINCLGIPALSFQLEEKRLYPHGPLFSHMVGYTDLDNRGIAGVEKSFHEVLTKTKEPLQLSLDLRVQHALRDELHKGMEEFRAVGAYGVILDTQTGEIIASVSLPDFDPNKPPEVTSKAMFNNVTLGSFEMGSTFKIFTMAMGLESGAVSLNSRYDASQPLRVGRYSIKDFRGKNRWLNVAEVFIYSSNIGTSQMALDIGPKVQREFFEKMGFLKPLNLPLPEVGTPLLPVDWNREATIMTISYGYGLSVSPLQLANGVCAMVNGGILRSPTLLRLKENAVPYGTQVISSDTSKKIRYLMELAVKERTGKWDRARGYEVMAKSGTAYIIEKGRYIEDKVTSCVAAFPTKDNPRYVGLSMFNRPQATPKTHGYSAAGWNAVPVMGRVIARVTPLLGIPPQPVYESAEEEADLPNLRMVTDDGTILPHSH
jgi:cell division protein FtsI (penicillin-binding protein 3)